MKPIPIQTVDRLTRYLSHMDGELRKSRPDMNWYHANRTAYMSVVDNLQHNDVFVPELFLREYKRLEDEPHS